MARHGGWRGGGSAGATRARRAEVGTGTRGTGAARAAEAWTAANEKGAPAEADAPLGGSYGLAGPPGGRTAKLAAGATARARPCAQLRSRP